MKAIVLVGGQATRLRPLTLHTPKCLIPVQGKPIVEHIFRFLTSHGCTDVILAVGYLQDQVKDFVGDGSRFGLRVSYVSEQEPLGTAGPLALVTLDPADEHVVVCNGDELRHLNLDDMMDFHKSHGGAATLAVRPVDDPSQFGVVVREGTAIRRFVEKPPREQAPSNLINTGMYIFHRSVWDYLPDGFAMLERDVFPRLAEAGLLHGFEFEGQWFDVGTPERLALAESAWHNHY